MEDDVLERVTRSRPRPISDDPSVAATTRELVHSAARTARRQPRRRDRTGFVVGIAVVAAACAAVIPVVTSQPPGMVDAIVTDGPEPANAPPVPSPRGEDSGYASASPESMQDCRILSRIAPDAATADQNLAGNLQAARDFLAEEDLESLPVEQVEASAPSSPGALSLAEIEDRALTDVETALGEAGLLLPGVGVEVTLTCSDPGVP